MTNQMGIFQKRHYDRKRKEVFYSSREYFSLTVSPFLLSFFERPLSADLFPLVRSRHNRKQKKKERIIVTNHLQLGSIPSMIQQWWQSQQQQPIQHFYSIWQQYQLIHNLYYERIQYIQEAKKTSLIENPNHEGSSSCKQ